MPTVMTEGITPSHIVMEKLKKWDTKEDKGKSIRYMHCIAAVAGE